MTPRTLSGRATRPSVAGPFGYEPPTSFRSFPRFYLRWREGGKTIASVSTHRCRHCGPCRLAWQDRKIGRLEENGKRDQTPACLFRQVNQIARLELLNLVHRPGEPAGVRRVFCVPTSSRSISSPAARGGKGSFAAPQHLRAVHNSDRNKIRRATGVSPWVGGRRIGIAESVPVMFLRSRGSSNSSGCDVNVRRDPRPCQRFCDPFGVGWI